MLTLRGIARISFLVALACLVLPGPARAVTLPPGFQQSTAIRSLAAPTDVEVAPNGRVFVAEKRGIVKTYTSLSDTSATIASDLRTQVHNYSNRGLLGLAIDPDFPSEPYIYVYYTLDAPIGGTPPTFGSAGQDADTCPGSLDVVNCVVSARVSRLRLSGETMTGPEHVLINDWCQQFSYHPGVGFEFGADGYLYVSSGDGARWGTWDYGQLGNPTNPCGDPPGPVGSTMTPPTAEGGRLRAQDLRTSDDPLGLGGSLIRIDPANGTGAPGNPRAASADPNERRMLAYGFRNTARLAIRPGTNDVWLGDWGGGYWEEINRVPQPTDAMRNFGWPCYEGGLDADGVPYARVRPRSEDQALNICEGLYAEASATTAPYWAYDHELEIIPGEDCALDEDSDEPGGKLWGMSFYPTAGSFPPAYRGALFFGDELRECIWAMLPGDDGLPARDRVINFAQAAASPLDMEPGPAGELLWIDEDASNVKGIRWIGNPLNQAPTALVQAGSTSGNRPLAVGFDATGSTDPDAQDVLTYAWDLDGDGELDDSTDASPAFTYTSGGTYTVTMRATDTSGASDTDTVTITVTSGPVAAIAAPGATATWKAGDTITFSGSASDVEDGSLPAAALDWVAALRHCEAADECHEHPLGEFANTATGALTAPDHADPAQLVLQLTATDSDGQTDTKTVTLQPRTAALTVAAAPAGAQVSIDGTSHPTPRVKTVVANSTSTLSAPAEQALGDVSHLFSAWSDGQARTHEVTVPSAGASYQASFASTAPGPQTLTFAPQADARVDRAFPDSNFGASSALESDNSTNDVNESFLRFLVGGISGTVTSAKLRLRATTSTVDGPAVFGTADEWSESGITWNNRPAPTTGILSDAGPIASGEWVEWDVTAGLAADGARSFRLASAVNDGVAFNSRETSSAALRPQLVVSVNNGGYPRPKGAGPVRFPLVPAYEPCASPDRTHGPPLAHPSCAPPAQSSPRLTTGTPDANGAAAALIGSATFGVLPGNAATADDEADVRLQVSLTDVRNGDLSDYTGELQARTTLRVTDRADGPLTLAELALPATLTCTATAAAVGATCALDTTLDALVPGLVDEGARAIWELAGFEVLDGGADGVAATPDNGVFARPGVFVP